MKKKVALVVNAGTYCDGTLAEGVLEALHRPFDVVYLTDADVPPRNRKWVKKVHTYRTPSFVLLDPELGVADPSQSPVRWALANPVRARQVYDWVQMLGSTIAELEDAYRPACVLVHFSLTASLMWIERNDASAGRLASVPHFLLYLYPGVPNSTIPWLFDSRLKQRDFELYNESKTREDVERSWNATLSRFSMNSGLVTDDDDNVRRTTSALRDLHHVLCWDSSITRPLKTLIPGMTASYVGSFTVPLARRPFPAAEDKALPSGVRSFLKATRAGDGGDRKLAFISFGSFGHRKRLRKTATILAEDLLRRGFAVIFHDTASPEDRVKAVVVPASEDANFYVHSGFVAYDVIIPHAALVCFTGSMCLQLICLQNAVPMVFVPLLTEQFFWAKNYEHFTGVPYVDSKSVSCVGKTVRAVVSQGKQKRIAEYLRRVKKSLHATKARDNLRSLVTGVVDQKERQVKDSALVAAVGGGGRKKSWKTEAV